MDYNKTRADAERRKAQLLERQQQIPQDKKKLDDELDQIKRQLIGIEQILDGLAFMDSDTPPDFEPSGFTDSIRKILSETTLPLVPTQIRDALEAKGITGSTSKNLLINVHKVLERIEPELEKTTNTEGKTAYKRTAKWSAYSFFQQYGEYGDGAVSGLTNLRTLAQLASQPSSGTQPGSGTVSPTRRPIRPMMRRRLKRVGDVTGPTSARDSGMLGDEKANTK